MVLEPALGNPIPPSHILHAPSLLLCTPLHGCGCAGAAREFDKRMAHIPAEWCCRGEEAAKQYNRTVLENLQMSPQAELFSAQPGLDPTC